MKRPFARLLLLAAVLFLPVTALGDDFGDLLARVNLSAEADFGAFKARLSTDFSTPLPEVELLLKTLPTPGDAYLCLKVAATSGRPVDVVVTEFNANRGRGWGVIAKNLGIKPGSREFHALKAGDFPAPGGNRGEGGKGQHGKKK